MKATITYTCGHSEQVTLRGANREMRASHEAYLLRQAKHAVCGACARAKQAAEAAAGNAKLGLPALEGSDKQIAWAESLRAPICEAIIARMDRLAATCKSKTIVAMVAEAVKTQILQQTRAGWWIDVVAQSGFTRPAEGVKTIDLDAGELRINSKSFAAWAAEAADVPVEMIEA